MRQYPGIGAHSLPDPSAPDFTPRLRSMLAAIDLWAQDASFGFGRIDAGEVPSGSGGTLSVTDHGALSGLGDDDHSQYLLLAGRSGGQSVASLAAGDTPLTISGFSGQTAPNLLLTGGSSNTTMLRLELNSSSNNLTFKVHNGLSSTITASGGSNTLALTGGGSTGLSITGGHFYAIAGRFHVGDTTNSAALSVDAAAMSTSVTNTDDNVLIVERATGQTGHAIRVMESTRTTTLFLVRADGHHYTTTGASDLTAQTGNIGATTLLTGAAGTAGAYRLSFYLKTTTAGNALDVVKVTAAWNDGSAQTLDIPFTNATVLFNNLDLATLNAFAQGSIVVYVPASQNITFTTTVTKTGSPQYTIRARIEALG